MPRKTLDELLNAQYSVPESSDPGPEETVNIESATRPLGQQTTPEPAFKEYGPAVIGRSKGTAATKFLETVSPINPRWFAAKMGESVGGIMGRPYSYDEYRQAVDKVLEDFYAKDPSSAKAGEYAGWGFNLYNVAQLLYNVPKFAGKIPAMARYGTKLVKKGLKSSGQLSGHMAEWGSQNLNKLKELSKMDLEDFAKRTKDFTYQLRKYKTWRNRTYQQEMRDITKELGNPQVVVRPFVQELDQVSVQAAKMPSNLNRWLNNVQQELANRDSVSLERLSKWKQELNAFTKRAHKKVQVGSTPEEAVIKSMLNQALDNAMGTVGGARIKEFNRAYAIASNTLDNLEDFTGKGVRLPYDKGEKVKVIFPDAEKKTYGILNQPLEGERHSMLDILSKRVGPGATEVVDDIKAFIINDKMRLGDPSGAIYLSGGKVRGRAGGGLGSFFGKAYQKGLMGVVRKGQETISDLDRARGIYVPSVLGSRLFENTGE